MRLQGNKLYVITPFIHFITLYSILVNRSVTKTLNFKERLCNVKLKDIDAFAKKSIGLLTRLQNEPKPSKMWSNLVTYNCIP